ncbi:protein EFR3 homolog A-like [Paramacrobiotus metropolitanus]|uniref:protein EFR3 homolog A-like n=1 Tax=Paramacrobiotus metropolitanus TaxID=2943436 RepID=UPI002445AEC9|nr:protein EFR3 homolog A-like [Paramacrobiotus metropolitanus]XP_055351729.1 protein EFR3 homolog A-like [Paramacrobiotus metropolitanus]XP_055351730.1 protein EFR3 homolog A-like [Paramacrobiotus metropolitanus]XP_055351731.1 protein EFR3 homolog A-like [Paramacrobiotus metropolitanus]XP_055351732.1 protein EFR3 homolog A-like [Paramacrobiotus metropolitanus]XP_055351733.1 protein EFR3 homolog A-like [Paramacrobiotus metropolitanus]XP_055351734.1 protein EFR3 homolog A-like [Paramacrobiotus
MGGVSSDCCGKCKPKYKRLVDDIYPATAEEGINRSQLDKLVFYSLSHPEKLDKIGKYLLFCLEYYIYRKRSEFSRITMEAMDSLLSSCKSSDQHTRLNLFVGSFLKMNLLLLECQDVTLQVYAVQSFVKFADIPEDIPSYHRSYDQFVDKFSMMCHNGDSNPSTRKAIRKAGMMGIRGIIRKTVSDDLQVNIWEQVHMDKIVPSLIFNMQQTEDKTRGISEESNGIDGIPTMDVQELESYAKSILQEICGRTMFANIKAVMSPALKHLDNNNLWVPGEFAIFIIKTICYAIPNQYAYKAVQIIVGHLDNHAQSPPEIKTTIARCLAETVDIATSVGPAVFEVFSALLRHLKVSVDRQIKAAAVDPGEQAYQEALVVTIGEFATNLPDYQKIEIMRFIMDKVVVRGGDDHVSATWLPLLLLRSLLKVATKYIPVQMTTTFPIAFLDLLMKGSLSPSAEVRILVHNIFHTLVDRHANLTRLLEGSDVLPCRLDLTLQDPPSAEDINFAKNNVKRLLLCMFENIDRSDNTGSSYKAINITIILLILELGKVHEDVILEFIRFLFGVQDLAVNSPDLSTLQRNSAYGISANGMSLIPRFINAPRFAAHIEQILSEREKSFHLTLAPACFAQRSISMLTANQTPLKSFSRSPSKTSTPATPIAKASATDPPLFRLEVLLEDISNDPNLRLDVSRLETKYNALQSEFAKQEMMDGKSLSSRSQSMIEDENEPAEIEAWTKLPADRERADRDEDISVDAFRRILHDSGDARRASLTERSKKLNDMCKIAPFKELISYQEKMDSRLSLTVLKILRTPPESSSESSSQASFDMYDDKEPTIGEKFEMKVKRNHGLRKLSSPQIFDLPNNDLIHVK